VVDVPKGDSLPSTAMKKVVVEPGQIELFEKFRELPPVKKSDPEGIENRLTSYFRMCADYNVVPSVESMSLVLGVTRQSLNLWEHDSASEAGAIIQRAKSVINSILVQSTMTGKVPFPYSIWLQKNHFSYCDSPQVVEIKHSVQDEELEQNLSASGLAWDAEVGDFVQV
jgi:hypothetical protein